MDNKQHLFKVIVSFIIIGLVLIGILVFILFYLKNKPDISYAKNTNVENIILIPFDKTSIDKLEITTKKNNYKRQILAEVSEELIKVGAKSVLLNYRFIDHKKGYEKEDKYFIDVITKHNNIYLPMIFYNSKNLTTSPKNKFIEKFSIQLEDQTNNQLTFTEFNSYQPILKELLIGTESIAMSNHDPAINNTFVYQNLLYKYNNNIYPNIVLKMAIDNVAKVDNHRVNKLIINKHRQLLLGNKNIPLDKNAKLKIKWYGPSQTYKYIPIWKIYNSIEMIKYNNHPEIFFEKTFKDKVVIIGDTTNDIQNYRKTPVDEKLYTIEYLATIYNNLVSEY